jgi:hypothetical protein
MKLIPTGSEVVKQALALVAAGILAAIIINKVPGLRAWMQQAKGE